jgi:uncharacterized protein (DUF2236 family)
MMSLPGAATDAVRRRLATSLRSRVAGEHADSRAERIWGERGQRRFTPDDPIWRVHADASMFVGGIRALLLQSLHPLAMAGVAGHSGYRGDPWGRLQRTSTYLAATTFGTTTHANEVVDHVRAVHERVRGQAPDGRPYAASNPHLLGWVHVAEVDSFLTTFQVYGPAPLTPAEADRYVAQTSVVATRLGVVDPPLSTADLEAALAAYRPELEATEAARDAARFLLVNPPLSLAARPGYALLAGGALATLPTWSRQLLGIPTPPLVDRLVGRPAGQLSSALVRWAMGHPQIARDRAGRPVETA